MDTQALLLSNSGCCSHMNDTPNKMTPATHHIHSHSRTFTSAVTATINSLYKYVFNYCYYLLAVGWGMDWIYVAKDRNTDKLLWIWQWTFTIHTIWGAISFSRRNCCMQLITWKRYIYNPWESQQFIRHCWLAMILGMRSWCCNTMPQTVLEYR